jgi:hypothetical protein
MMSDAWLVTSAGDLVAAERVQKISVGTGTQSHRVLAQLVAATGYELLVEFNWTAKGLFPDRIKSANMAAARQARLELIVALDDARRLAKTLNVTHTVSYASKEKRWRITNLAKQGINKAIGDV